METGFPLVMLGLPSLAALAALGLRRWPRVSAGVGLLALALMWLLLWLAAPGEGIFADGVAALGRPLVLTPALRGLFLFLYPALALLFGLSAFRAWGRALVPGGLAMIAVLAAALLISPAGLGAVLLAAAVALTLPTLYSGRREAGWAAWRAFLMSVLGLVALILVSWLQIAGQPEGPVMLAGLLMATLILLGGFPFHIWVRPLARSTLPGAAVLMLGLLPFGVTFFLMTLLDLSPGVRAAVEFQSAVCGSVLLTALLAAFLMSRERTWRGWVAAALLLDAGFLLTGTLAPGAAGLATMFAALIGRYLSLLLVGLGLQWSPAEAQPERPVWRRDDVLRAALLIYGCLSLVGLPLTPGFAGRWAQLALLASPASGAWPAGWPAVALSVLALAAAAWTIARAGVVADAEANPTTTPGQGERVAAAVLLGMALLLGLFPGLLFALATRMAGA